MQEGTPSTITSSSPTAWRLSVGFCILVIGATLGLWGYTFIQEKSIEDKQSQIATLEAKIQQGSKDKQVLIANIIEGSKIRPSIDLTSIVESFRNIAAKNAVRLQGFSVQNDILSTSLTATSDTSGSDPVGTIISMMRAHEIIPGYRLEPIYDVQGDASSRMTNVSFKILPTNK